MLHAPNAAVFAHTHSPLQRPREGARALLTLRRRCPLPTPAVNCAR